MRNGREEKSGGRERPAGGNGAKGDGRKDGNGAAAAVQNALVLQGGGAVAAYEAGVYGALYFWIKRELEGRGEEDRNIFDVVAGTSGGAINGTIIVSHVLQKRRQNASIIGSWRGSLRKLLDFWEHVSSNPDITMWGPYSVPPQIGVQGPLAAWPSSSTSSSALYMWWEWPLSERSWVSRWDGAHRADGSVATGEAARRYYSSKEFLYSGAPNVFSRLRPVHDGRFFDDFAAPVNTWYRYDNAPLRKSITDYARFPIATSFSGAQEQEKRQPRLLMVSVDVQSGALFTFDSYGSGGNKGADQPSTRRSEAVDYAKSADGAGSTAIEIKYDEGITADHVMASSSVPVHYDSVGVPIDSSNPARGSRRFWDGGVSSNTPLRQLIQAHEDYYWNLVSGEIPDLNVYIANVWPIEGGDLVDHDSVVNRRNDLTYQDKTLHEEKVAYLVRDYIDLAHELMRRAKIPESEMRVLLDQTYGASRHRDGKPRKYGELLRKVRIAGVTRIQRRLDPDEVSYKWCDYSAKTVTRLIEQGFEQTLRVMTEVVAKKENKSKSPSAALGPSGSVGESLLSEIDAETTGPGLAGDERLTGAQAAMLKNAVSAAVSGLA
jgi:predicted acylesterase/phospholipase RssA